MIELYKRLPRPHHDVGLLCEDSKVLCEDGRRRWSPDPRRKVAVYTDYTRATRVVTSGRGELVSWGGRPINWREKGNFKAFVLKGVHDLPYTDEELIAALVLWRDWVEDFGAQIASIGSTSTSLFKVMLDAPLFCGGYQAPRLPWPLLGGRQYMGQPPGTYDGPLTHWDLSGAYPSAMRDLHYAGWVRRHKVDLKEISDLEAQGYPTFVAAKVWILETGRPNGGPLPDREDWVDPMIDDVYYPTFGSLTKIWTGPEVLGAIETGCGIEPMECWIGRSERQPFLRFVDETAGGRDLPGFAAHLAKMTRNALWGQFAIVPQKMQTLSFTDGERLVRDISPNYSRPPTLDLAETITGRVRAKLYRELIWPAQAALLCAHTDGGWVWADEEGWSPQGEGWKVKDTADVLDMMNPQSLAYLPYEGGGVRYVMAGVTSSAAERVFAERWRSRFREDVPGVFRGRRRW